MTIRAAALALAAPLLFTVPALASDKNQTRRSGVTLSVQTGNGGVYYNTGNRRYGSYGQNRGYQNRGYRNRDHHRRDRGHHGYGNGYQLNEYGQSRDEVDYFKRRSIRACRRAILSEANYIGFHDVDFDRRARTRQVGPRGFRVRFKDVEFEGHRRDFERDVICTVRGGENIKRIEGMPRWGRRDYSRYSQSDWRTYDRRHVGHDHSRGSYCPADYGY